MKKFCFALALCLLWATGAFAQVSISQLPTAAVPLQGNEVVAGVQNGQTVQIPETAFGIQGPASAVSGHLATFNGTTGKLIQDGGAPLTSVTCFGVAITTSGTCTTTGQIPGTATNDSAGTGKTGEYVTTSIPTSTVSLSTGTAADAGTISLTAGDWDVSCNAVFTTGTNTSITQLLSWTSLSSATLPTFPAEGANETNTNFIAPGAPVNQTLNAPVARYSLSGTTTIYCSVQGTFTVSTLAAGGFIRARRVR